ncbi:Oidioi.mRNA.OKI2018_I69.chr2.g8228.t1.cds [Oikopleura dioica]|uniref:Oidioi.mRNA.OKI2018_I69.chr2.g8228.t1.cds n=1 Tax=Oikopleura dioica TaxID=34765 RepID=A0ABN7TD89_OIKDI|nr:Oidioi.mRNA.OKI2018_I69.chr2.g8228.t1.cds [Oikopleura dioica]
MGGSKSKLSKAEIKKLEANTKFTKAEILRWYKGFIQDCPSGELSRNDFTDIYAGFFPKGNAGEFAHMVFQVFDVNGDGTIEFDEFLTALSITSKGTMEEKLEWAFKVYDLDDNGTIDREEMVQIVKAMISMAGDENAEQDAKERVAKIFDLMDTDGNGELSKEEFLEAAKRDQSIVQALSFVKSA